MKDGAALVQKATGYNIVLHPCNPLAT